MQVKSLQILLSTLAYVYVEAKSNFRLSAVSASCEHQAPLWTKSFQCFVEERNNRFYGYGHIAFRRPSDSIEAHVIMSRQGTKIPRINFINIRLDVCDFLEKTQRDRFINFLVQKLRSYMNEMPSCPMKTNFNYTVTDAVLDLEGMPIFVPYGNLTLGIYLFEKKAKTELGRFIIEGVSGRDNLPTKVHTKAG